MVPNLMPQPGNLLGPAPGDVMAFDVGGTDIKGTMLSASGDLLDVVRVPTPRDGARTAEAVLDRVRELSRELSERSPGLQAKAAGLVVPGIVNARAGVGVFSANLGWTNFPFRAECEKRLGLPVAFGHDVTSAGIAEFELGAGHGFDDVVVIIIGTGIAGTVFAGGLPVTAGGYAGEFGHSLVPDPSGTGTEILESVGSAAAIARRYTRISGNAVDGASEVLTRMQAGDIAARQVWDEAIDALAFTVSQCITVLGTEAVIVGGGLSEAGDELLVPLRRRVGEHLTFHRRPEILQARLGQDAGLIGAALGARSLLAAESGQA
ncbi:MULTISPECIES: ROK family protein [unclassified Pseudarthrobacter]|uniref:ROK family protein n=1 Tax=unclassified Pseudarthrobacter TaxID=2647000 RepID=UPI001FEF8A85|nr:ROK family protein [Pseudarthrobacter sp. NIBRBAC000502772]